MGRDHDEMDPSAELLAAVEAVAGDLAEHDLDRLRYWAKRVTEELEAARA